jgi:hypothetical protein
MEQAYVENPGLISDLADEQALEGAGEAIEGIVEIVSAVCTIQ